jgi:hypothetical protein
MQLIIDDIQSRYIKSLHAPGRRSSQIIAATQTFIVLKKPEPVFMLRSTIFAIAYSDQI